MTVLPVHRPRCNGTADSRVWGRIIACIMPIIFGIFAVGPARAQSTSVPAAAAIALSAAPQIAPKSDAAPPVQPTFDVISIHPNKYDRSNHSHIYYSLSDSHFRSINATVLQIIQWAYELPDSRILNSAPWTTSAKYDIEARSDATADAHFHSLPISEARREKGKMVQAMLVDRFHLSSHVESRELPVYDLVVAKNGPKFSPAQDAPKHVDDTSRGGRTTLTITSSTHASNDLAEMLYRYTGRVVIDKTGLTGNYTLALHFASDDSRAVNPDSDSSGAAQDTGPSVFTAIKEQLGLELKSGKAQVDVLVIDSIDPPTEN
jgi:uncharacterized protein (TIGR03435 family)